MTNDQLTKLVKFIGPHLFLQHVKQFRIGGKLHPVHQWSSACRGVDIGGYRFVTQNPAKDSRWAELARRGDKIIWVIAGDKWVLRYHNGEVAEL